MSKSSAGILLFRRCAPDCEVFLVHPGGPFWRNKDVGAWSIPKGEYADDENPLAAAKREFAEETGVAVNGRFVSLGEVKQSGGKIVKAWALEQDLDASSVKSNTFELEWPPKSGSIRVFPEVDKAEWFSLAAAKGKILSGQVELLRRLAAHLEEPTFSKDLPGR